MMCFVEVLYSLLLSYASVKLEFGFVIVFHINLTTLHQIVLCDMHTIAGRFIDGQRFYFAV